MAKSIMQENKDYCFLCGRNGHTDPLDCHHQQVFYGTANRKLSEQYGLKVYICHDKCHLNGVHKNANIDNELKAFAQQVAMKYYEWSAKDFINIFGKNYL